MLRHRLQGAEFFRASSPRSRYVVRSKTLHQHRQSLTHLRARQSGGIKHPNRRRTRDSPLPRVPRWRRDCRPHPVNRPTCNQIKGQAFPQASRRPSKVKSSETPAAWRSAQRQSEETRWRSLATTSGSSAGLATNDPRWRRTPRPRALRGSTIGHRKVGSEPSWLATSSAMNSNPAIVGSGDCSRRAEAPLRTLILVVDPRSVEARSVRADLREPRRSLAGRPGCNWPSFATSSTA
jgi:hypothetical protein